jgi:hypothetical protein
MMTWLKIQPLLSNRFGIQDQFRGGNTLWCIFRRSRPMVGGEHVKAKEGKKKKKI